MNQFNCNRIYIQEKNTGFQLCDKNRLVSHTFTHRGPIFGKAQILISHPPQAICVKCFTSNKAMFDIKLSRTIHNQTEFSLNWAKNSQVFLVNCSGAPCNTRLFLFKSVFGPKQSIKYTNGFDCTSGALQCRKWLMLVNRKED